MIPVDQSQTTFAPCPYFLRSVLGKCFHIPQRAIWLERIIRNLALIHRDDIALVSGDPNTSRAIGIDACSVLFRHFPWSAPSFPTAMFQREEPEAIGKVP